MENTAIPVLKYRHVDITAERLSGLMAQGFSPRMAFLQYCWFNRIDRGVDVQQVRIVEGK